MSECLNVDGMGWDGMGWDGMGWDGGRKIFGGLSVLDYK